MQPGAGDFGGYFRDVYHGLVRQPDGLRRRRFLDGELAPAAAHLTELEPLRVRERMPAKGHYTLADDQLRRSIEMYALSRISDYLLESSCPDGLVQPGFGVTGGRRVDPEALATHTGFLRGIGLTPFEHGESFSPFHHEVFAVVTDDSATAVTVEEVLWPGLWFGDLLFSRAGVRIRAPRHLIDAAATTTSPLYFTFRRYPRRTSDPSHGWGANSQWSTRFARFYADADGFHFNWDGRTDIGADPPVSPDGHPNPDAERSVARRRELLLNRCFVRMPRPIDDDDWYPFDGRMSVTNSVWPLPEGSIVHPTWSAC
ncbi:hypothetical protein [Pseudonocardia sp. TRM90224]|uniref:hypothetical protein n=1 Tax=Pseudonocardia sp. TRM90224 TaxID=2812678 RepID=UPI001E3F6D63|nr:hypothetical protein [Pseudonocardia sp. TRM90224]